MARVVLPRGLRDFAGVAELEVDAGDVRQLVRELERRYPGFREHVEGRMSVAIDGDIVTDPMLEALEAGSEVHFLPRVGGG